MNDFFAASDGEETARIIRNELMSVPPLVMKAFSPLSIQPLPRGLARVVNALVSEPAFGSVPAIPQIFRPAMTSGRYCLANSPSPKRASVSPEATLTMTLTASD